MQSILCIHSKEMGQHLDVAIKPIVNALMYIKNTGTKKKILC